MILTIMIGGGGGAYGAFNLVVQLASLLILAVNSKVLVAFLVRQPFGFVTLICSTLALPLIQLVPLPPSIWTALPGRDLLYQSLELIGHSSEWFPISLAPSRTLTAFLSLIPAATIIVLASSLNERDWGNVLRTIVFASAAISVLGGIQLLTSNKHFLIFSERVSSSFFYTTFANHNTSGLYFVLALIVVLALDLGFGQGLRSVALQRSMRIGALVIFVISVILSQSRSSMGVLLLVVSVGLALYAKRSKLAQRHVFSVIAVGIVLSVGTLYVLQENSRLGGSFGRFESLEGPRPAVWSDTISSIQRFWPVGSGISSFPEVFEVDETLEHVWEFHAGRAHNDYLEIAQEAGIAGIMLTVAWGTWCVCVGLRARNGKYWQRAIFAIAALATIAIQSIVDYPLRNQTILCFVGLFIGMLASKDKSEKVKLID